jgi:hypothetical protein
MTKFGGRHTECACYYKSTASPGLKMRNFKNASAIPLTQSRTTAMTPPHRRSWWQNTLSFQTSRPLVFVVDLLRHRGSCIECDRALGDQYHEALSENVHRGFQCSHLSPQDEPCRVNMAESIPSLTVDNSFRCVTYKLRAAADQVAAR